VGHWSSFSAEYDQEVVVGAQARTDIQFLEFRQNLEGSGACQLKVSEGANALKNRVKGAQIGPQLLLRHFLQELCAELPTLLGRVLQVESMLFSTAYCRATSA